MPAYLFLMYWPVFRPVLGFSCLSSPSFNLRASGTKGGVRLTVRPPSVSRNSSQPEPTVPRAWQETTSLGRKTPAIIPSETKRKSLPYHPAGPLLAAGTRVTRAAWQPKRPAALSPWVPTALETRAPTLWPSPMEQGCSSLTKRHRLRLSSPRIHATRPKSRS